MQGGFSIREYASRMRSIDVVSCWPFDENFSEETVKSLLPPIVVKRFRWWLDELEFLSSETAEKLALFEENKKKVLEKGETSSRNVSRDLEAVEEGLKAVKIKSLKGKMRATKKRSILEIFAVAPPVMSGEEEEVEEEEDDDDDASCNEGINRASKKKKKKKKMKKKTKNTDAILRKALRVVKKIKRKKENCLKLKLQTQEKATGNSSLSCSKEVGNDIHDFLSIPKRKPRLQHLGLYKKLVENQNPELHVRGILKNRDKDSSLKQSKKCILQEAVRLNNCSAQKANKHVTFSENGEFLRLSRKPSQSVECYELQKDFGSDMGNVDYAVAVGKDSTVLETSGSEDTGAATNEQFTRFNVDSTTFGKQKYEGEYSTRCGSSERHAMYSVNQHWSDHRLEDAPHYKMDGCSPGFLHMPRDGYYNSPNIKVITTSSNATCRRLNKDIGSQMWELLKSVYSLPDGSQAGDVRARSTNGINEDFVGLPLNSQGELIALNSSAKREDNQMMNSNVSAAQCIGLSLPSNAISKCLGHHSEFRDLSSRTSSTGQLNLFPVESFVKENAMAALPSRLGIIESQSEKANLDLDFLETNYHPFHNPENTICRGDNQVQKSRENEKFQSTMRLMGKEFEVGGRGVQGFEDDHIWKDKPHFQNQNHSVSSMARGQSEPSFRQLRETLFCPSEITVDHRSERKYSLPQFDCQTSSTYKSTFLARTVDCAQKLYPEVYDSRSRFSEAYTAGYDSQLFTLELPTATAPYQELCSDMSPGATQLKNKQNLHYSPVSSIKFPFMHPDLDGHANSSWPRRSPLIQHPLCFDVSEKATQLRNSQSCTLGRNDPYLNPGTSCGINASVSFQPDDFCMLNPLPSGSVLQSVAPAPMPYYSGVLPVSAMQRKHRNQNKIKERIKSRIGVRGLDIGKKSALSNAVPYKPFKRPILGFHDGHQCGVRKPAAHVSFEDSVKNMEGAAFESCSATKNPRFVMSGDYDPTSKDGQTILPCWSDSYIEAARTGPIKLTAGAKHVLKPRQQKDHSSTRSTDQDISLSATNIGFRFSDSENSAQIYRF